MKKGISLIVLVITIIVMIVIAGAIILALNSSNVTNKASWAQISADRANLQSEYATILANIMATDKVVEEDYTGVTIDKVRDNSDFKAWVTKVTDTNSRFEVHGDGTDETVEPAGVKVVMKVTEDEAKAFGIYDETKKDVVGYDWVSLKTAPSGEGTTEQ